MKRSLIFGLIAVLSAGLLLVGCGNGTDGDTKYINIGGRLVDVEVTTGQATDLSAALLNPNYQVIGVTSADITLPNNGEIVKIPEGKTVVLYAGLTVGTVGLQVEGTLIVEGSGVLTATATTKVWVTDGQIEVNNGTISIARVGDIYFNNPGSTIEVPALGTGRVAFRGGNLTATANLIGFDDVKTAFGWVPQGEVTLLGVDEPVKPSDLANIETTLTRRLTITNTVKSPGETGLEALTIPVGLSFGTDDFLSSLTSLTVLGYLDLTNSTLGSVVDLTVAGGLTAANATYTGLTSLIVSNNFTVGTLTGLNTLTVDGGIFTAASVAGGAEGLTFKVEEKGDAEITAITGLKEGLIAGILNADSVAAFGTPTTFPLTAAAGALVNGINFTAETTTITALAPSAAGVTTEDFVVPDDKTLTIPESTTLTIASGSTLTYNGLVTIEATGVLKLATAATAGARIAGIGTITAGATTITGSWEAVGIADTGALSITGADTGATIAGIETKTSGLKASAAGATITQNAGESNNLVIEANTTIDLDGTETEVGVIILKNDTAQAAPTNNGKLTLSGDDETCKIKTANVAGAGTSGGAIGLAQAGVTTAVSDAFTAIGILNLAGNANTPAKVKSTAVAASGTAGPAGKLVSLEGNTNGDITGGGSATDSPDGRISATTVTEATAG
jgi:hypothetical protein